MAKTKMTEAQRQANIDRSKRVGALFKSGAKMDVGRCKSTSTHSGALLNVTTDCILKRRTKSKAKK